MVAPTSDRKVFGPVFYPMSKTYVIPDIHGRYDLLCDGLAEIAAHSDGAAVIVTIGDYVDKGPQSREVVERLLFGLGDDFQLIALKGNHV